MCGMCVCVTCQRPLFDYHIPRPHSASQGNIGAEGTHRRGRTAGERTNGLTAGGGDPDEELVVVVVWDRDLRRADPVLAAVEIEHGGHHAGRPCHSRPVHLEGRAGRKRRRFSSAARRLVEQPVLRAKAGCRSR